MKNRNLFATALVAILTITSCSKDDPASAPVHGVDISHATMLLPIGHSKTITATVTPDNAANKTLRWSSDNSAVATVDEGVVTGVAHGTAIITVTTVEGEKTAICTVTVDKDILLNPTAGGLGALITNPQTTTSLKIMGTLNEVDFKYIRENMPALETLDLSLTDITEIPLRALCFYGGEWGLSQNKTLAKIVLPETITKIGDSAFAMCNGLEQINIPASVRTLGKWMFEGSSSNLNFTTEAIPDGVVDIPESAFFGCMGLKKLNIPASVKTIGSYAFKGCGDMVGEVIIPATVSSFGGDMFYDCDQITSIVIKSEISKLPNNIFQNCLRLETISLPNTITEIGSNALCNTGLTTFDVPASVTIIGEGALCESKKLVSVKIHGDVKTMGFSIFNSCPALKSVQIAEGVASIEAEMFRDCVMLTDIVLPSTITQIRDRAFQNCSKLATLTCKAISAPTLAAHNTGENDNFHFDGVPTTCVLKVPNIANYSAWSSSFKGSIEQLP